MLPGGHLWKEWRRMTDMEICNLLWIFIKNYDTIYKKFILYGKQRLFCGV